MANGPYDCPDCGLTHRHGCHGHAKHTSDTRAHLRNPDGPTPCHGYVAPGGTVCRVHGVSPNVKAKAARRVTEEKAAKVMRMFGEPINTTPSEALLDTVQWTAGYVAWLRDKVAEFDQADDLVWGRTREKDGVVVVGNGPTATLEASPETIREAKPNVWLTLLGEWSDRLVKVCTAAISAGIEERRVRLAESQGQLVADVIRGILADLGLTGEQQAMVATVVPLHLRRLAS